MNVKNLFKNVLLASHPVGSIFITTDGDFDPHAKWGGTWELLQDSFLVGAGNTYTLGASGGEATHALTVNEMPSHAHDFKTHGSAIVVYSDTALTTSGFTAAPSGGLWGGASKNLGDIANTGSGAAHNNLPPYTAVNMWLRTA